MKKKSVYIFILILVFFIGYRGYQYHKLKKDFSIALDSVDQIQIRYFNDKSYFIEDSLIPVVKENLLNADSDQTFKETKVYNITYEVVLYTEGSVIDFQIIVFKDKNEDYSIWEIKGRHSNDERKILDQDLNATMFW